MDINLRQFNPLGILTRSFLILFCHFLLCLSSDFCGKILHAFLVSSVWATCPVTHNILLMWDQILKVKRSCDRNLVCLLSFKIPYFTPLIHGGILWAVLPFTCSPTHGHNESIVNIRPHPCWKSVSEKILKLHHPSTY